MKIGLAKVDYRRCIAYAEGKDCLVCQENCPYLAVKPAPGPKKAMIPQVDPDACTGCGNCEKNCPAEGAAAIRVFRRD